MFYTGFESLNSVDGLCSYPHDSFIFMQVTESVISIGFLDTAKVVKIIFFRKKSAILPICTVRKAV
jgi:hypothetical protein